MSRLLTLLCAGMLVAAGCGGDDGEPLSSEEYEQRVEQALDEVESSFDEVRGSRSRDDLVDRLSESADAARSAADDLEDADAPEEAEGVNDRLVEALRGLADELDRGAEAAEDGSPAELLEAARDVGERGLDRVESALRELEQQGIEVPELQRP